MAAISSFCRMFVVWRIEMTPRLPCIAMWNVLEHTTRMLVKRTFGLHRAVMGCGSQEILLNPVSSDGVEDLRELGQHPDLLSLAECACCLELAAPIP